MKKRLFQWTVYSIGFLLILYPVNGFNYKAISISVVIGFFAGLLNSILINIKDLKK